MVDFLLNIIIEKKWRDLVRKVWVLEMGSDSAQPIKTPPSHFQRMTKVASKQRWPQNKGVIKTPPSYFQRATKVRSAATMKDETSPLSVAQRPHLTKLSRRIIYCWATGEHVSPRRKTIQQRQQLSFKIIISSLKKVPITIIDCYIPQMSFLIWTFI